MIVGVQGSKSFDDYSIFLRAVGTALTQLPENDNEFFIYSIGPANVNRMAMEFSNITERSMKAKGIKVRMTKIPFSWAKENITDLDYFIYLSKPKERNSELVDLADRKDIEVGVYRY